MIKWLTLENQHDTRTLKQHGFIIRKIKKAFTHEVYDGNRSLCGKIVAGNEDEEVEYFINLEEEPFNETRACKLCRKLAKL